MSNSSSRNQPDLMQHQAPPQQQQQQTGNAANPQQPQRQNSQTNPGQQNQGQFNNSQQLQQQPRFSRPSASQQQKQQQQQPSSVDSKRANWNSKPSVLSPLAKEFQPTLMPPQTQTAMGFSYYSQEEALAEALTQIQMMGNPNEFSEGGYSGQSSLNDDNTDCILTVVTDSINEMSTHPANFNRCAKGISEVLKNYMVDAETLGVVVTLLIEQVQEQRVCDFFVHSFSAYVVIN
jgi:hypothetical protein